MTASGPRVLATIRTTLFLMVSLSLLSASCAMAENAPVGEERQREAPHSGADGTGRYRTPLAGEQARVLFMGTVVEIPAQDRSKVTALTLGGSAFAPKQGNTLGVPIVALYLKRVWEGSRTRDIIGLFVNELEYDKSLGAWELATHFENETLPYGQTVVVHNQENKATSLLWGTILGSAGPGLRYQVAPFQVDNDLRLQLLGRVGYFYARKTSDTGAAQLLPPDTLLYGARVRLRYDGLRRNLLELPHHGLAAGADLDYLHRDRWAQLGGASQGASSYWQAQGYLTGAGGIPGLSEQNRVLLTLHAGTTRGDDGDRFNAFRVNGGPFPTESDDLSRPHYQGTIFDDALVTDYAMASLIYRRELAFFIYLSLKGAYIYADRATVLGPEQVAFRSARGAAGTIALDSAFFGNSSIYLAYAWDSGFIRGGKPGSGVILTWNKSF